MDQKKEQRLYQLEEDIRLAEYNQAILLEELEDIRHKKLSGLIEINEQWNKLGQLFADDPMTTRSEERRVGKECRSRWSPYH